MFGGWGAPRVVLEPGEELSIHYGLVNHLVSRKKIVSHLLYSIIYNFFLALLFYLLKV